MKQFLLNQTMDDADEGCLGGLVFHWYCIVNSRPKSHSDSQPAPSLPLSSFLLFLTSCTLLPLSLSFSSSIAASLLPLSPLCIVSRNYSRRGEPRGTLAALGHSLDIFPIASVRKPSFSCSRASIYTFLPAYYAQITCHFIFIYTLLVSFSFFRCLARSNRSFLSFPLARDDSIT